jgi:superfamily II DNA helicase RecQ
MASPISRAPDSLNNDYSITAFKSFILKLQKAKKIGDVLEDIETSMISWLQLAERAQLPTLLNSLFNRLSTAPDADEATINRVLVNQQTLITNTLTRLLTDRIDADKDVSPRPLQVIVLNRLLFAKRDVILVANTGFGKSIVYQGIGVLTGKISIVVCPLLGLCDQAQDEIAALPGCRPIVVSSETKLKHQGLGTSSSIYEAIRTGRYTHIILRPEQLMVPEFRKLVRDTGFRHRIGALIIDEAHCVSLWSSFRPEYTHIHAFRRLLGLHVVLFACTATLNPSIQMQVVQKIGFNQRYDWNEKLGIVRTSTDRPDLSIVTANLPAKDIHSGILFAVRPRYRALHESDQKEELIALFRKLNQHQQSSKLYASTAELEMTVIFASTRTEVRELKEYIRDYLTSLGCISQAVRTLVRSYTSKTGKRDRIYVCDQMRKGASSEVKILVATTAFGMGLNIRDIETVVQYRGARYNPNSRISGDLMVADAWQRGGRAARGNDRRGIFYICLEHDIGAREKRWMNSKANLAATTRQKMKSLRMEANRATNKRYERDESVASQHGCNIDDINTNVEDHECGSSDSEAEAELLDEGVSGAVGRLDRTEQQNDSSLTTRLDVFRWSNLQKSSCKRRYILSFLGENMIEEEPGVIDIPVRDSRLCCNGCNVSLTPEMLTFPKPLKEKKPPAHSEAAVILPLVERWADREAGAQFGQPEHLFCSIPGSWLIPEETMWKLCRLPYSSQIKPELKWRGNKEKFEDVIDGVFAAFPDDIQTKLQNSFHTFMKDSIEELWKVTGARRQARIAAVESKQAKNAQKEAEDTFISSQATLVESIDNTSQKSQQPRQSLQEQNNALNRTLIRAIQHRPLISSSLAHEVLFRQTVSIILALYTHY